MGFNLAAIEADVVGELHSILQEFGDHPQVISAVQAAEQAGVTALETALSVAVSAGSASAAALTGPLAPFVAPLLAEAGQALTGLIDTKLNALIAPAPATAPAASAPVATIAAIAAQAITKAPPVADARAIVRARLAGVRG